jgi:DNA-binding MarR family transcriptional regulator
VTRHHAALHVLVAAVTAAERDEPMPKRDDLASEIGCAPAAVSMALASLEGRGVIERIGGAKPGRPPRVRVVRTGAATKEVR